MYVCLIYLEHNEDNQRKEDAGVCPLVQHKALYAVIRKVLLCMYNL